MGCHALRVDLSERACVALGLRPSAGKPSRPGSGRGQGRQPPKAGARSASLEPGRAPVYSTQLLSPQKSGERSRSLQRLLLMPAILAGELDSGLTLFRLDPVRGAALAADRLDAGRALLDDEGFLFHRFADQALGLLTQRLFRQSSSPPLKAREPYRTCLQITIGKPCSDLDNHIAVFDMYRKRLGDIRALLQFLSALHRDGI